MLLIPISRLLVAVLASAPEPPPGPPSGRFPTIVAHRGASADAPENTLAAFRLGFEQGAEVIEGDFRLTRDGRIIAMHDADLARTTGDPRRVSDVTLEDVRRLDAGSWGRWRGSRFEGEPVPTLEEVLAIVPPERGILVEIKDSPRIVEALLDALRDSGLEADQVTIISFDASVIESLKRASPKWKAFWLTSFKRRDGAWTPTVEEVVGTAQRIGADGVDVKAESKVVDEDFVRAVRAAGLELHVWTVNESGLADRLRNLGVDSITTDRPAGLRREMSRETDRRLDGDPPGDDGSSPDERDARRD